MINNLRNNNKGLTLIELLVVIAIIGFLVTIITAAIYSARGKARDARRMHDLRQLSNAIEMYYTEYGNYPRDAGFCSHISNLTENLGQAFQDDIAPWLIFVPLDPSYHNTYRDYIYQNIDDRRYKLYAELENDDILDDGLNGCDRIDGTNNEYDYKYPY